ncbi:hypothetical protein MKW94_020600 [Papaver nudicaule]|uniref:Leucine-rich repeat-containing N-terminal plant-type domain-containing protein n=1 Tax=Papaver nudicaule TaxID=74823 RepID=A0AA41VQ92_PAPNU|nr:hypothetical protein [Papaver nudicaule]
MQNQRWVFIVLLIFTFYSTHYTSLFFFTLASSSSTVLCSDIDRAALLGFKSKIISDTTGTLSTWVGKDCCNGEWEGIQCNPTTGRVMGLVLQGARNEDIAMYMKGTLSPSLSNLEFLEIMVITGMKQISGSIPESFSKLRHLNQLVLEDNSLGGTIPASFGQLSLLNTLSLSGNHLKGNIPPSIGTLQNLLQLNLAKNSLSGSVPPTFKTLKNLQYFDLSHNLLSGFVPGFIGGFKNLTFLDFSNNQFSGEFPSSLCYLPNLLDMSLSHNKLTGNIPIQISNLKSLSSLSLSFNHFHGQIPEAISKLQNLWYFNVSSNNLSDPLPVSLKTKGIPSLLSLDLSYNNLHLGKIPDWILKSKFTDVHLAGCHLKGPLPKFLTPSSLNSIDFSDNQFSGGVSGFLLKMSSLQKLKLSNNLLKFNVSEVLRNSNRYLEVLDVSSNQITGGLPEFRSGLRLKSLSVSRNKISGRIPSSISALIELEKLDVSRNQIMGTIPPSLGELVGLKWLDVSINRLTGKIPDSLLRIENLRHANFRANRLCGQIPQGRPFNIFPAVAYAHNQCLCGKPLPPCKIK